MRIVILSHADYASSGFKLYQALYRHSENRVRYFAGKNVTPFKHSRGSEFGPETIMAIKWADIIHLKGDWPYTFYEKEYGFRLDNKPLVQTVSGWMFRSRIFPMSDYKVCAVRTSWEPDLLFPEYDGVLTPYPIDSLSKDNVWRDSAPPIFTHFPTNKVGKDTPFIKEVFKHLDAEIIIPRRRVTFKRAMEMRMCSTIYFDQFGIGAYGNAAVEMMQYGIPVAAWISPQSLDQGMPPSPVITAEKTVDAWVEVISKAMERLPELSVETKQFCDNHHSYQAVAKQWDKLYQSV